MKHFIRIADLGVQGIEQIFDRADSLGKSTAKPLYGKTVALFMPASSIRTRIAFERGVHLLGGQTVLFPAETLDKPEAARDVMGYMENWVSCAVIRHRDIDKLYDLAIDARIPVINAMTDINHPCEITGDLYAIRKRRIDYKNLKYLYVGTKGNIGLSWREAARTLNFEFAQCCPEGFELGDVEVYRDVSEAARGRDVVITDQLPAGAKPFFERCRVSKAALALLNPGGMFIPCPPFFRGEELESEALSSPAFAGYAFKETLLRVQQAIMLECMEI